MFTVTNNTGRILTLYNGATVIAAIANGAVGNSNQLNVSTIGYGDAIFANSSGTFADNTNYTATYQASSPNFPQNNVLFANGLPGGNVRFF
ncbi:hypothetical protein GGQ73_002340 [Rhizobium skierniewicense]|uniref:Uncharacterized protein n=1 Tax=Rhizobium skierniewicense TaxID=984260 RepID=A0A7W6G225_9HYPH|nr:hypothetical protein [Rhizobium skierniewicense]MBB3946387.1 hypothetical protein [Rhizobium skierniewicense]